MSDFIVQLQDYQIIEQAKLKFIDGLNIIVGPSNNGKSSILRAIEAAIYNKAGNAFIKSGKEAAIVAIKCGDHVVLWKKSVDSGVYKIDGQVYNKIGRGQPVEVMNALGIGEIVINTDKVRVNFLKQMEYPFLLDRTPSQLFEFLSMSNDTEKLSGVFGTMRSDLKKTNSEIDILNGKIDSYKKIVSKDQGILDSYKDIDKLVNNVLDLDSKVSSNNKAVEQLDKLNADKEILREKKEQLDKLKKNNELLISSLDGVEDMVNIYKGLLQEISPLENTHKTLKEYKTRIESSKEQLDKLNQAVQSVDIDSIKQLKELTTSLKKDIQDIDSLSSSINVKESTINNLRQDFTKVNQEFSSFKVCPLCGKLLDNHKEEAHG